MHGWQPQAEAFSEAEKLKSGGGHGLRK